MAQPYLRDLEALVESCVPDNSQLEVRHFFSGAALYAQGTICVSLTPVGLAFKFPAEMAARLIDSGAGAPLRYFAKGPIKKNYVLFADVGSLSDQALEEYFGTAIANVLTKK